MNSIEIGDYVMISYDCDIIDNNSHPLNYLGRRKEIDDGFPNGTKKSENFEILSAPIIIKNDVWIGMKCLILKGVVISERSIVAANTKVNKSIESDTIYYGSRSKKLVYD
jgi:acetyltransferase-like isoleucine patch superfamily enzyme